MQGSSPGRLTPVEDSFSPQVFTASTPLRSFDEKAHFLNGALHPVFNFFGATNEFLLV
jgi:hypothetical protein